MVLIRAEIALISLWFERYIAVYLGVINNWLLICI